MSLGDSLMPDRTPGLRQDVAARETDNTQAQSPTEKLFARTDANLDGEFTGLFGPTGPEARAALEGAAATEGPAAYHRFRADPDAFGTVTGDRARADVVGGAFEALVYSKAVHAAEQEGRTASVPGYDTPFQAPSSAPDTSRDTEPPQAETQAPSAEGQVRNEHAREQTPEQVREALDTIRWCLTEGHVTHADLIMADRALYRVDQPGDASMVIRTLNGEGLLATWAEELNDGITEGVLPPFNGFDAGEREAFYNRLSARLDGAELGHFARAIESSSGLGDLEGEGGRFGRAVATYASPEARADFVDQSLPRVFRRDGSQSGSEFFPRAVAETVAGLRGHSRLLGQAIDSISGQAQDWGGASVTADSPMVVAKLLSEGIESSQQTISDLLSREQVTTYDASLATEMVRSFATVNDPSFRARAFIDASAVARQLRQDDQPSPQRLDTVPRGRAERDLRGGMTELLNTRTNETIDNLMTQGGREGLDLSEHIRYLILNGDDASVVRHIRSLQHGDDRTQNAGTRFVTPERNSAGHDSYANAARLGYYIGAVTSAMQSIADEDRRANDTLASIVGDVVPIVGASTVSRAVAQDVTARDVSDRQLHLQRLTAGMIPTVRRLDVGGRSEVAEVSGPEVEAYMIAKGRVINRDGQIQ